jgi:NAD(P)-dependent dehydrogenase (short-subunit alcohol dehydrogenase family)
MTNTVLITGTSNGFGRLTTLTLARHGHTVVATMRDIAGKNRPAADELRRTAEAGNLKIHVIELDVASDASVTQGVDAALAKVGHLDVVINNAGIGIAGLAETTTPAQLSRLLDVNVVGVQRVNRAVLPSMRARRGGLIVHVSSGLGRLAMPLLGVYAASKWALEAIAETYRYELKPAGIDVSIVQPGTFQTNFAQAMDIGADQQLAANYGPLANGLAMFGENLQRMMSVPNPPDPQEVADAILALIDTPPGTRPARVQVDRFQGQGTAALNEAHANVQRGLLGAMGMSGLAD